MWETPTRGGAPLEPEDGNGDGYFAVSKAPLQRGGVLPTRSLPLPALRFFLRSADEIRSVYVPQS
ncbi:hypothetical protein COCSUDRAFT_34522 [Coccomyxa subellipsoidea C-169]|uniref:Uncharacterized protein n=1 Tax=Coccomyxa subellipsoidea (strain C-169) TaxID=574566 RepID=I0YJL7_COCSC|nr:hypothetical protein COCSUDRAFT_34522 [Coccomyxa subellipsoidea C-169]EIE18586.1 hypothetical protein COCSUDRAFT_34522 [Coccomyxa subellipsoidea C-169]|eukprot:XP_005643130.1 hypothetical protein COCSUDRAFT_34522 [Coccomyxa subellipsoidea C-169]